MSRTPHHSSKEATTCSVDNKQTKTLRIQVHSSHRTIMNSSLPASSSSLLLLAVPLILCMTSTIITTAVVHAAPFGQIHSKSTTTISSIHQQRNIHHHHYHHRYQYNSNTRKNTIEQILSPTLRAGNQQHHDDDNNKSSSSSSSSSSNNKRTKKKSSSSSSRKRSTKKGITSDSSNKSSSSSSKEDVHVISAAMKEKDSATAMGDAIRARASDLLQDEIKLPHDPTSTGNNLKTTTHYQHPADISITSLRYAIGSSDGDSSSSTTDGANQKQQQQQSSYYSDEGGGVEPTTSAVIANYFLKSHGGLHSIQSLTSLLSVLASITVLYLSLTTDISKLSTAVATAIGSTEQQAQSQQIMKQVQMQYGLVQRTFICALSKHLSGFVAMACMTASRLPSLGWRETRRRLNGLVLDPVGGYLFYCALLLLWTSVTNLSPSAAAVGVVSNVVKDGSSGSNAATATIIADGSSNAILKVFPWWLTSKYNTLFIFCLVGPILLREVVSTVWVLSDIMVLLHTSSTSSSNKSSSSPSSSSSSANPILSIILSIGRTAIDTIMSILLTPTVWLASNNDAASRQRLLAKLVGRCSIALELMTGLMIVYDAIMAFGSYAMKTSNTDTTRPKLLNVLMRIICARLYVNFMLVRKKKIEDMVTGLRGGGTGVGK